MSEETTSLGWYRRLGLQRAAWIAGGALLLLAVAAVIAPSFVDWNRYRNEIAAAAERATGRAVTIGGDISFTLLPAPALRVADLSIANLEGGEAAAFARLDYLDVVVEALPLLSGDLSLRRLVLNRPAITLERLSDGRANWHFPAIDRAAAGKGDIRLQRFEIRDGRLRYIDRMAARQYALDGLDARLTAETLAGPYRLSGAADLAGSGLTFELRSNRFVEGRRTPLSAEIAFAGSRARYNGWLRFAGGARPAAAGDLLLEGDSLAKFVSRLQTALAASQERLSSPLLLQKAFSLEGRLETGESVALSDIKARLGAAALTGNAALTPGKRPHLDLDLRADGVDLDALLEGDSGPGHPATRLALPDLPLPFDLALSFEAAPLSFRGEIVNRIAVKARSERDGIILEALHASLPGASTGSLTGEIAATQTGPRLTGRAGLSAGDLRRLLDWLGLSLPQQVGGFGSGRIETTLAADREAIHLTEIDASVDAAKAGGELTLSTAGETPRIETSLTIDRVDLDRYLPQSTPAGERGGDRSLRDRLQTVLEKLPSLTGRAHIVLDRLRAAGTWMNGVSLRVAMAEEALTVEEAQVRDVFGASAGISGRLEKPAGAAPGELRADILLRADIPALEPIASRLGLALPASISPAALAPLTIEGRLAGGRDSLAFDLSGRVAGGRATLEGRVANAFDEIRGPAKLELRYDHPSHRALAERFAIAGLSRSAAQPVHLVLKLTGVEDRLAIKGDLEALGGALGVDGQRRRLAEGTMLAGGLEIAHPELRRLIRHVLPDYEPRAESLGPLALNSRLRLSRDTLELTGVKAAFGPAEIAGEIAIRLEEQRPRFDARLETGTLPLKAFLPVPKPGPRWSTAVFDLAALNDIDGELVLSAEKLDLSPYRLQAVEMAATLENGRLALERLDATLFGARTRVSGRMDVSPVLPTVSLALALEGGDLGQALAATVGQRPATGVFDLGGRFAARGNSPFGLVNTLSGDASLSVRDGSLEGFDLSRLATGIERVRSADTAGALVDDALSGGSTLLESLQAQLSARGGILRAQSLQAQLGSGAMTLEAELDLAGWSIASSGRLSLAAYPQSPPIVIELGGSLDAPHGALEAGGLRLWLVQRLARASYAPIPVSESLLGETPGLPEVVGPPGDAGGKAGSSSSPAEDRAADARVPDGRRP